jgi:hypothetical protein
LGAWPVHRISPDFSRASSAKSAFGSASDAVDHVDHQVEAVEVVEHHHVEGRGGGAFFLVAAHVQVGVVACGGR